MSSVSCQPGSCRVGRRKEIQSPFDLTCGDSTFPILVFWMTHISLDDQRDLVRLLSAQVSRRSKSCSEVSNVSSCCTSRYKLRGILGHPLPSSLSTHWLGSSVSTTYFLRKTKVRKRTSRLPSSNIGEPGLRTRVYYLSDDELPTH